MTGDLLGRAGEGLPATVLQVLKLGLVRTADPQRPTVQVQERQLIEPAPGIGRVHGLDPIEHLPKDGFHVPRCQDPLLHALLHRSLLIVTHRRGLLDSQDLLTGLETPSHGPLHPRPRSAARRRSLAETLSAGPLPCQKKTPP